MRAEGFVRERLNDVKALAAFLAGVFVSGHGCLIPRAKTDHDIKPCGVRPKRPFFPVGSCNGTDSNMLRPCFVSLVLWPLPISSAASTSR
jgi:hypothetical protein